MRKATLRSPERLHAYTEAAPLAEGLLVVETPGPRFFAQVDASRPFQVSV